MKSSEAMILTFMNAILAVALPEKPAKIQDSTGFEPVEVQNFSVFWLRNIAKIALITVRIITSLHFISTVQYMIHFIYHFVHLKYTWEISENSLALFDINL